MDPRLYLTLADRLMQSAKEGTAITGGTGAVECRTAIGRAYYAAFLVARDFLEGLGIKVPNGSKCHTTVKDGLNNSGVASLVIVSAQLGTLYDGRAAADYKLQDRTTESTTNAEVAVTLSRLVIRMLDVIASGGAMPPLDRAAVASTILKWAADAGQPLTRKPRQ